MADILQVNALESVKKTIDQIDNCVRGLSEDKIRWKPSKEEWSIMQVIVHLGEAIPFWVQEIRNIKMNKDYTWGRGLTDETRVRAISKEKVNGLSVEEILKKLSHIPFLVEETLESLTAEDLDIKAPSRNPRFKEKTVGFIVDHLIVEHIEKHYGQIQRLIKKISN
ncbi:hypothetical protein ABE41_018100 [Fictibacillus arsenicus]|uniref:DinB-like domain-containing protein n=1 Tax=Fictibacillus arsenicus TaxID=255247 RepID=A0A1B1Z909_9BACL|nr:DinB family protein [Fictibacillus arsenicus]ANX13928.1 hypothetical protein ABE41_018100 [Fictibacillus arsenicus]